MPNETKRVLVLIPTYEPHYIHNPELEEFYIQNFDSFYHTAADVDLSLVMTDFASSKSYKAFLRKYVDSRPGCFLIDGDQEASVHVAMNIGLRNFEYDYAIWAACDLRARDRHWLEPLLREFDDPRVQIAVPTVTFDGHPQCEQNQPGPVDRESRTVRSSEIFNLHCAVFSKRFFQLFDNKFPDISDTNFLEYCLVYQLAALAYTAKVNFLVNLVHDRMESIRPRPGRFAGGWRSRNKLYDADRMKFLRRATILPGLMFFSTTGADLIQKIHWFLSWIQAYRWRFLYFQLFSKRVFDDFFSLDIPTKVAVMKALFYRPEADYEQFSYSVYSSSSGEPESQTTDAQAPSTALRS